VAFLSRKIDMKVKKVNRYYCEFCKKSGCSARWIRKHEERCTLNPNRYCGYCHLLDQKQSDLNELMALLPDPKKYKEKRTWETEDYPYFVDETIDETIFVGLDKAVNDALPELRSVSGGCPACIMAALRQKGIPIPMVTDFDFKAEGASIWADFNKSQRKEVETGYY